MTATAVVSPVIEFIDVAKHFTIREQPVVAVSNVNLQVYEGEFLTIVGPSGCGKSTLLNLSAGLFAATTGTVKYRGMPVTPYNRRTGYMTQSDHLLPWRSVAQNVLAPLEIAGLPKREARDRVQALLELVGLLPFADSYPSQISGGMRKRAVLARLLAYDPETLLLDEPFAALDAQLRQSLQSQVIKLCRSLKKTVLFVTHDLDEAVALGDRCVVFTARPGTIQAVIPIDLGEERDLRSLRFDPRYVEICATLWNALSPEVDRQALL